MSTSTPVFKNDLLLRALRGSEITRPPVWVMRQAGRYLPEYREVRSKADFFSMVQSPRTACEVTLQPIRRYGMDAAIIFSDILVIPQALGLEVTMHEGEGPQFPTPIADPRDLERLRTPNLAQDLGYVCEAIRLTVQSLNNEIPLLGFAGAPWTLLAYMCGSSGSKSFGRAKRFLYQHRKSAHALLETLASATTAYLKLQIEAGASAVQLFDSWAGELGPDDFCEFSLPYLKHIIQEVNPCAPVILFAKGAAWALEQLADCGPAALGLDWTVHPEEARRRVPHITLQGNLDPSVLHAPAAELQSRTEQMLRRFGKQRYIANLGHGITPEVDPAQLEIFVRTIQNFSW